MFVNTRMQAELLFQELWRVNDASLPIALHHGSLDAAAAPQGRGGDGGRHAAGPWSPPRRSISASTGATSISSSTSARRRARAASSSASAAPITASTSPRRPCSCRPTASRCWNAAPRIDAAEAGAQDVDAVAQRRARRAGPARARHGVRRRRSIPTRSTPRSLGVALRGARRARTFDRVVDFVADRRLRAQGLRALRQAEAGAATARLRLAHPRFVAAVPA